MKKYFLFLFLFFVLTLFSQSKYSRIQTIKVLNNKGELMANLPVTIIETKTKLRLSKNTNEKGIAIFNIPSGKEWAINILEMKNCSFFEVNENGNSTGTSLITYDVYNYKRTHGPKVDRKLLGITTVDQTQIQSSQYKSKTALVNLQIKREDGSSLNNFYVNLTCYKDQKTYLGKTDSKGKAIFVVPINSKYEVDIDGIDSFDYIDTKDSGEYGLEITYEPTNVKENIVNDTIVQSLPKNFKGTSSRVAVNLKVNKIAGNDVSKEYIYLQMLGTNKVYKGKMDKQGLVSFLLPSKNKYLIHFIYQKDVDVLNFTHMNGIGSTEANIIYNPNPKLEFPEKFIPKPDQLFLQEFQDFMTKQYPNPIDPIDLHVSWANDSINAQSKEAVLELGFKIRTENNYLNRPPINLALVVDRSGSMEGDDRIGALKKSLLNFVSKLRKTDIVSLVSYDDQATLLVPSQPIGDGKYLKDMIEDIEAGGGTNIYNGMVLGYEQIQKKQIVKGTNRLVLLTDGYGADDPLITIKKSKTYNDKGIELSAIGVGEDYNQALLSQLATTGGGLLNFVGSSKNIENVFQKELMSILGPLSVSDVSFEISYNDKIIFKQLHGFPFTKIDANHVKLKLDALYPGLRGIGLVKFDLFQPSKEIEKMPVTIKMTYYDLNKLKYEEKVEKVYLKWVPGSGKIELILEKEQKKAYAIAVLNQGLKVMSENFAIGNYAEARNHILNVQNNIKEIYPNALDSDIEKLMDEMTQYANSLALVISNNKN